jgi:hypothetical protein
MAQFIIFPLPLGMGFYRAPYQSGFGSKSHFGHFSSRQQLFSLPKYFGIGNG